VRVLGSPDALAGAVIQVTRLEMVSGTADANPKTLSILPWPKRASVEERALLRLKTPGGIWVLRYLTATARALPCDARGSFKTPLAAGFWVVEVSADGYDRLDKVVQTRDGYATTFNVGLNPNVFEAEEVVVTAHRERPQAIQASVSQAEIKEIPGTFGDALRAVQNLPGVGLTSDLSGQLLVQGAGPNDNLYLVDGIPWPIPFHFGGLVSTVSPELLEKVDLYEAGYGARWGGSLASVVDATTVAPPTDRLHVDLDLGLLQSSGALAGPVGLGDATFTLTGRRSYFDLVGGPFGYGNLPTYWDSQGVLDFSLDRGNSFHGLFMASDDAFNYTFAPPANNSSSGVGFGGSLEYDVGFQSGGVSWINTSLPNFKSTLTPFLFHKDQITQLYATSSGTAGGDTLADNTFQTTYGIKEEAVWNAGSWLGAKHEVGAGGDAELSDYSFFGVLPRLTYTPSASVCITCLPTVNSTVASQGFAGYAYLQDRVQFNDAWALTLGLHYDSSTLVADGEVGPRASLEWKPVAADKWTLAWGLYDQAPNSMQVNPQYGNPGLEPESAEHTALSYEHDFNPHLTGKADVYYKTLTELVVTDGAENPDIYDNKGVGDVKGLDLDLKEDLGKRLFAWATYSLSNSDRLNLPSQAWGLYEYDQPNIFNLVGSYCPDTRWTFGGKFRYNSGNLYLPVGDTVYTGSYRLPNYARLDLRAERAWRFDTWSLTAYLEVLNVTGRKNIAQEYVNSKGQTDEVPDLPRLPNIGMEVKY
jgi:hypothetical protein